MTRARLFCQGLLVLSLAIGFTGCIGQSSETDSANPAVNFNNEVEIPGAIDASVFESQYSDRELDIDGEWECGYVKLQGQEKLQVAVRAPGSDHLLLCGEAGVRSCSSQEGCYKVEYEISRNEGDDLRTTEHPVRLEDLVNLELECFGGCAPPAATYCGRAVDSQNNAYHNRWSCVAVVTTSEDGEVMSCRTAAVAYPCDENEVCQNSGDFPNVGVCEPVAICDSNQDCDNGQFCDGEEFCGEDGRCYNGDLPSLEDPYSCTLGRCDEENDVIVHDPVNNRCDDGAFCNGTEICSPLDENADENGCLIVAEEDYPCQNPHECVVGSCNEETDSCEFDPSAKNGDSCNDNNACSGEDDSETSTCQEGECITGEDVLSCPAADECTAQVCVDVDGEATCADGDQLPDGTPCSDGACFDGTCTPNLCALAAFHPEIHTSCQTTTDTPPLSNLWRCNPLDGSDRFGTLELLQACGSEAVCSPVDPSRCLDQNAQCDSDEDCGSEQTCHDDGICRVDECLVDSDCPEGYSCLSSMCMEDEEELTIPEVLRADTGDTGGRILGDGPSRWDFVLLVISGLPADPNESDGPTIEDMLSEPGPFTLLAPTDGSLAPFFNLLASLDTVDQIEALQDHILAGEIMSADLSDGQEIVPMSGNTFTVRALTDGIFLEFMNSDGDTSRVQVTIPDLGASNGVIHGLNGLLGVGQSCSQDSDCGGGQECGASDLCVVTPECSGNGDCDDGDTCTNDTCNAGICEYLDNGSCQSEGCGDEGECPDGEACFGDPNDPANQFCHPIADACSNDGDCDVAAGEQCVDNMCLDDANGWYAIVADTQPDGVVVDFVDFWNCNSDNPRIVLSLTPGQLLLRPNLNVLRETNFEPFCSYIVSQSSGPEGTALGWNRLGGQNRPWCALPGGGLNGGAIDGACNR